MLQTIMNNKELLDVIKPEQQNEQDLRTLLSLHPEVKFVSLMEWEWVAFALENNNWSEFLKYVNEN